MKILLAAILTCAGSRWIDFLYKKSSELTFPEEILARSRFRRLILFISLAILFKATENFWIMAAIFLLVLMTLTDFEQYMLFDAMTLPLAIIGAILSYQSGFLTDNFLVAFIGGGIFLLLAIISRGSIGGGDIKLIAALGLLLGAEKLLNVVLYGSILGGISGLMIILIKKKDRKSYFAYGPYFTLTAIYFLLK